MPYSLCCVFPHVDPTLTVDNLTAVLRLVEGNMQHAFGDGGKLLSLSNLWQQRVECILKLEQRAAAAAMCYISSHCTNPTWKDVTQRLRINGEVKAAMAAKTYLNLTQPH